MVSKRKTVAATDPGVAAELAASAFAGLDPERLQLDPFDNESAARSFEARAWVSVMFGAAALLACGFGLGVATAIWRGW